MDPERPDPLAWARTSPTADIAGVALLTILALVLIVLL